jgi:hypothetical protein
MLIPGSSKPKKETAPLFKELLNVEFYIALTCPPRRICGQPHCVLLDPASQFPNMGARGKGQARAGKKNSKSLPQKLLQPANSPIQEEGGGPGRAGEKSKELPQKLLPPAETAVH